MLTNFFESCSQGRIVGIYHSFLPAYSNSECPYRLAYDRGVKAIGATCHYVTPGPLHSGPVIEQDVVTISHKVGSLFHPPP